MSEITNPGNFFQTFKKLFKLKNLKVIKRGFSNSCLNIVICGLGFVCDLYFVICYFISNPLQKNKNFMHSNTEKNILYKKPLRSLSNNNFFGTGLYGLGIKQRNCNGYPAH